MWLLIHISAPFCPTKDIHGSTLTYLHIICPHFHVFYPHKIISFDILDSFVRLRLITFVHDVLQAPALVASQKPLATFFIESLADDPRDRHEIAATLQNVAE